MERIVFGETTAFIERENLRRDKPARCALDFYEALRGAAAPSERMNIWTP